MFWNFLYCSPSNCTMALKFISQLWPVNHDYATTYIAPSSTTLNPSGMRASFLLLSTDSLSSAFPPLYTISPTNSSFSQLVSLSPGLISRRCSTIETVLTSKTHLSLTSISFREGGGGFSLNRVREQPHSQEQESDRS